MLMIATFFNAIVTNELLLKTLKMNEETGGMEVNITLDPQTMIFVLFNAFILFLIMKKFLFGAVMGMIEKRRANIENDFITAEKAKTDALSFKKEYEDRLANANEEKAEILHNARKRGEEIAEKLKTEGEKERERILKAAETEKNLMVDKATEELRRETVDLSIDIARQIIKKELDFNTSRKMVDSIINDLSGLKM